MYKVYMYVNAVNGKKYIGTTQCKTLAKRAGYGGNFYRGSPAFYNAILKYGWSAFKGRVICDGLTKAQASEVEAAMIVKHATMDLEKGYNLQAGGFPPNKVATADRNKKISATLKAVRSKPEYRQIMRRRMLKTWSDPVKKASILQKRRGKQAGRPPKALFCLETNTCYPNLHVAGAALGIRHTSLSYRLKTADTIIYCSRKLGRSYTLSVIKTVHPKESELLETSADNAGGNQQPCAQMTQAVAE